MPREIKTVEELNAIVAAAAAEFEICDGIKFGTVSWHEPDEGGCNWSVNFANGPDAGVNACMAVFNPIAVQLRATYNLPDPV